MTHDRPPAPLMTTAEVAAYLSVSERTLERWRSQGIGPRWVYLYRSVRYHRSAVARFLVEHSQGVRP